MTARVRTLLLCWPRLTATLQGELCQSQMRKWGARPTVCVCVWSWVGFRKLLSAMSVKPRVPGPAFMGSQTALRPLLLSGCAAFRQQQPLPRTLGFHSSSVMGWSTARMKAKNASPPPPPHTSNVSP